MHTCSQFLQIIPPAYTPAIRRLWKNPPNHFWKIPAGHPLESSPGHFWKISQLVNPNTAYKPYQESTFTKHFVCLAVLSALRWAVQTSTKPRPSKLPCSYLCLWAVIRRYTPTRPFTPNYIAKTQGFSMPFKSLLKS